MALPEDPNTFKFELLKQVLEIKAEISESMADMKADIKSLRESVKGGSEHDNPLEKRMAKIEEKVLKIDAVIQKDSVWKSLGSQIITAALVAVITFAVTTYMTSNSINNQPNARIEQPDK